MHGRVTLDFARGALYQLSPWRQPCGRAGPAVAGMCEGDSRLCRQTHSSPRPMQRLFDRPGLGCEPFCEGGGPSVRRPLAIIRANWIVPEAMRLSPFRPP